MKSRFNKYLLSFLIVMFCFFSAFAQKRDVPVPKNNDDPPPGPGLPIDGGLSYLLIAGIAYGIYETKKKK